MPIFRNTENIISIDHSWLERLKEEARNSPNYRSRLLMHTAEKDAVQEMIIAVCKQADSPLHRSLERSESLQVLEGKVLVAIFDEKGKITNRFEMGPIGSGNIFIYRITSVPWHIIIPLTEVVVIHESLQGPFQKVVDPLPSWAPHDPISNKAFIENILKNNAVLV
ncbi:MAG: hypothetical protein ACD_29C00360G0003 [uncultured bacterium]|nr:MAG: hypothetical protein ACD_29C00360G0003 [uncultured bacterium]